MIGWQQGETPTVPQGFRIEAVATGLSNPRNVYPLPNSDLLVIESKKDAKEPIERPKRPIMDWVEAKAHGGGGGGPSNRILLPRDANGDGKPASQTVLIDHLNSPFGVVVVGYSLYVADTDPILRFPFKVGDTKVGGAPVKLVDLPAGPINHHWTKSLTASPDGSKLYVGVGSNSNCMERGVTAERMRAAIWEVDRATGAYKLFASGLRNPNGLTFYPGSDTLWAVVNERDELGPNVVPDYMAPAQFDGGAFVGEHGSWNRPELNGYRVVFIKFQNGRPVGEPMDFVTGFVKDGKAHGRPVGVAVDRTGALIVADDVGKTVWRVTSAGAT